MIELTANECRVLGVLIEKALTTPNQYPLSINAMVDGCNQKNNRDPVVTLAEDEAFDAVESLRAKGLVVRVDQAGSRVTKFRHHAGEVLHARTGELAILGELLLRGPQTLGELRGRASRMAPMETLEVTRDLLRALMERAEPLVRLLPREAGSRAENYTHLLSPYVASNPPAVMPDSIATSPVRSESELVDRVRQLEAEVNILRSALKKLSESLGEGDPFIDH